MCFPFSRSALLASLVLLCACAPSQPLAGSQSGASKSLGATVWGSYKSTLGFAIKYPPGWDMNHVGNAVAFYPKSTDVEPGDGGSSAGLDVYSKKGSLKDIISQQNDSENGGCKDPKEVTMGAYKATLVECVSVLDGRLDDNYFVPNGDGFFQLSSDAEDPGAIYKTMRANFRITQ